MSIFKWIHHLFKSLCEWVTSVAWPMTLSEFLPTSLHLSVSPRVPLLPFSPNHLCYSWDSHPQSAGAALPNQSLINITRSVFSSPAALSKNADNTSWNHVALNVDWPLFRRADCATRLPDFIPNLYKPAVGMNGPPAVINERLGRDGVCEWIWGVAH